MSKTVTRKSYKLKYVAPSSSVECGFVDKSLVVPFFQLGCPGEEEGFLGKIYTKQITELNFDFFGSVAQVLYNNKLLDWHWDSFRENILMPNKHHIIKSCNIPSEELWERFVEDGYVFLNHWFDDDFTEEEYDGKNIKVKNPNRNSVFTDMDVEY